MLKTEYPVVLAPTGMIPTREQTPHVPLTPAAIAKDVAECAALGISSVHIHARDEAGRPDWRRETYARIVGAVREAAPEVLINVSTSGRTGPNSRGARIAWPWTETSSRISPR